MAKVKLSDVVARIKDKVEPCELTHYIGGEHFEYASVTIDNKALIKGSTIGPAFHIRFMPGDVLLMSRNPHLRKAGMVDFEGLCSDVSYVCRTKDESVLLQKYLPFLFQTEDFWRFAEANKKGSTNFFLNWSDFEKYEFSLPPLAEQKKLAETLWAMERVKRAYKKLLAETDRMVEARFVEMFGDEKRFGKLKNVAIISSGLTKNKNREKFPLKMPYLRVANVFFNRLDLTEVLNIGVMEQEVEKCTLQSGDLLFVEGNGSRDQIGRVALWNGAIANCLHQNHIIKARFNKNIVPVFAMYYFLSQVGRKLIVESAVTSSGLYTLSTGKIGDFEIPLPPLPLQREFAAFVAQAEKAKASLKESLAALTAAQKSLMNEAFKEDC